MFLLLPLLLLYLDTYSSPSGITPRLHYRTFVLKSHRQNAIAITTHRSLSSILLVACDLLRGMWANTLILVVPSSCTQRHRGDTSTHGHARAHTSQCGIISLNFLMGVDFPLPNETLDLCDRRKKVTVMVLKQRHTVQNKKQSRRRKRQLTII